METSITQATTSYDQQQLDLIKSTVSKNLTDQEFALLVEVAKRTGLDLFTHQLYGIKRGEQMTIQTGIDGYRLMAARTGDLAGIDDVVFEESGDLPSKASVTVWRFVHGQRVPFTASARWSEYKPEKGGPMWSKMPFLMLGKCAEALALRKAFPAELSGIYTREEMDQADADPVPVVEGHFPGSTIERVQEFQQIVDSTNPATATAKQPTWADLQIRSKDLGFNLPQFTEAKKRYPTIEKMKAALDDFEKKRLNQLKRRANELGWTNDEWEKALKDTNGNYDQMVDRVEAVPQTVEG